jgi:hypothetical protein
MSDTPESDKAKIAFTSLFANDDAYWVPFKVSCKLERERDEVLSDLEFRRDLFKLQEQQLNDVRAERDRLAEVIKAATVLIAAKGRHNTMLAYRGLKEALAAVEGGSDE